ncbi:MAG: M24 family metallopeptidase, partial [Alphaproteobacteria bacterium]
SFEAVRDGARECDMYAAALGAMHAAGADPPALPMPLSSGPNTLSVTHMAATRRRLRPGDPITVEVGAAFNRYHSVACHTVAFRNARPEIGRLHASVRQRLDAGRRVIGPGVPTAEVARAIAATFEGRARERWQGVHFGYGFGIGFTGVWLDNLRIKGTDKHVLEPGMSFFLVNGAYTENEGAFVCLGDAILVTERGFEDLSGLARDGLLVLGRTRPRRPAARRPSRRARKPVRRRPRTAS